MYVYSELYIYICTYPLKLTAVVRGWSGIGSTQEKTTAVTVLSKDDSCDSTLVTSTRNYLSKMYEVLTN